MFSSCKLWKHILIPNYKNDNSGMIKKLKIAEGADNLPEGAVQ